MNMMRSPGKAPQDDAIPSLPQTPPPDWQFERDSGHIWSSISGLREKTGELTYAIVANTDSIKEFRGELKSIDAKLVNLESQIREHLGFVKGASWVIGVIFTISTLLLAWAWSSIIQPGLAHAIVEQIKPEISKQVSEGISKQQLPHSPGTVK